MCGMYSIDEVIISNKHNKISIQHNVNMLFIWKINEIIIKYFD